MPRTLGHATCSATARRLPRGECRGGASRRDRQRVGRARLECHLRCEELGLPVPRPRASDSWTQSGVGGEGCRRSREPHPQSRRAVRDRAVGQGREACRRQQSNRVRCARGRRFQSPRAKPHTHAKQPDHSTAIQATLGESVHAHPLILVSEAAEKRRIVPIGATAGQFKQTNMRIDRFRIRSIQGVRCAGSKNREWNSRCRSHVGRPGKGLSRGRALAMRSAGSPAIASPYGWGCARCWRGCCLAAAGCGCATPRLIRSPYPHNRRPRARRGRDPHGARRRRRAYDHDELQRQRAALGRRLLHGRRRAARQHELSAHGAHLCDGASACRRPAERRSAHRGRRRRHRARSRVAVELATHRQGVCRAICRQRTSANPRRCGCGCRAGRRAGGARTVRRARLEGPEGLTVAMRNGLLVYFGNSTLPHAKWLSLARVLSFADAAGATVCRRASARAPGGRLQLEPGSAAATASRLTPSQVGTSDPRRRGWPNSSAGGRRGYLVKRYGRKRKSARPARRQAQARTANQPAKLRRRGAPKAVPPKPPPEAEPRLEGYCVSRDQFSSDGRGFAVLQRMLRDCGLPLTGRSSLHNLRILTVCRA